METQIPTTRCGVDCLLQSFEINFLFLKCSDSLNQMLHRSAQAIQLLYNESNDVNYCLLALLIGFQDGLFQGPLTS